MEPDSRHFTKLTAGLVFLFVLTGILTVDDYGMGWDEVTRWEAGDLKLEYYKALFSGHMEEVAGKLANDDYPGLFDLPLAVFHSIFGGNRMIQGHLLSILYGAMGLLATSALGSIVFNRQVGFYSALLLSVNANFYGHSMINPKDIPFLATYMLATAVVFYVFKRLLKDDDTCTSGFAFSGIATGLAASSRLPGLIFLGIGPGLWIFALIWRASIQPNQKDFKAKFWGLSRGILITCCIALIILFVFFSKITFPAYKRSTGCHCQSAYKSFHHTAAV